MNQRLDRFGSSLITPFKGAIDHSIHYAEYLAHIDPIRKFLPYQEVCFNPYPLVMPQQLTARLERLSERLLRSLTFVATSYVDNKSMQTKMPIPERLMHFLTLARGTPYHMGTVRPDLLFGKHGEVKVCEINARFPLNGMALSQWVNHGAEKASYLSWNGYQPIKASRDICAAMLARFCIDQPVVRVASSEGGGESRFFLSEFQKLGGTCYHARPEELNVDDASITLNNRPVNDFILEIDREELLQFNDDVIKRIIRNSNHINDIRTLILIHDKRILSLLSDHDIMRPHLSPFEHNELISGLLANADLHNEKGMQQVLTNKNNWVLKKCSGGRGIDMHIGKSVCQTQWEDIIKNDQSDYTAQEYLEPSKFPIAHKAFANRITTPSNQCNPRKTTAMNIVGSLPCFDGTSFGPGMFRASQLDCVNIGDGRGQAIFLASVQHDQPPPLKNANGNSSFDIFQAIDDTF